MIEPLECPSSGVSLFESVLAQRLLEHRGLQIFYDAPSGV